MLFTLTVQAAHPPEFTMAPIDAQVITQPLGKVHIFFNADITMRNVSSYQLLLSVGSIEGNCQKDPAIEINQSIQNVIAPAVITFSSFNSCTGHFNFGGVSNPCSQIRHHINPRFTFAIDVDKLQALSGTSKTNWENLHLSIREQNQTQSCASQPLLISVKPHALIKISALDDMVLKERDKNRYKQDEPFCVFVTDAGLYKLKASGGTASNSPFLLNNGKDTLPYTPSLVTNNRSTPLTPGIWANNLQGSSSVDCHQNSNAKIQIVLKDSESAQKPPGIYTGTLFLTVEVE